jgi:hypothetical protein
MNYQSITAENQELYAQLEKITVMVKDFNSERERILKQIEKNLEYQSIWWPAMEDKDLHPRSSFISEFLENPNLTMKELGLKFGIGEVSACIRIAKYFKKSE